MGRKERGRRRLVVFSATEETEIQEGAQLEALPVATFVRRAALLRARELKRNRGT